MTIKNLTGWFILIAIIGVILFLVACLHPVFAIIIISGVLGLGLAGLINLAIYLIKP